jgi:hypothetical protein
MRLTSMTCLAALTLAAATAASAAQPADAPATPTAPAAAPASPATTAPAAGDMQSAPAASAPAAPSASAAGTEASVTVGQPVKDNTGATIGKITKLNPPAGGKQTAVIAMGAQSFAVDTSALAVQNGAAVINASQSELKGMIAKSGVAAGQ